MVKAGSISVALGISFFAVAVALFGAAAATRQMLGPFAMTAAQLGVLAFYWFPWSYAGRSHSSLAAVVGGVLSLAVSLMVLGASAFYLIAFGAPFLGWGPFLVVHLAANIALALRPRVYLWWMLGVWTVGSLAVGVIVGLQASHPGGSPPVEILLTILVDRGGSNDWAVAAQAVFWLASLASFFGTAAGLGFAMLWRRRRLDKEAGAAPAPMSGP